MTQHGILHNSLEMISTRGLPTFLSACAKSVAVRWQKNVFNRRFIVKNIHNYKMYLDTEDRGLSRQLILFGTREVEHKVMLERIVTPGMRIFDIGANIGYYALLELGLVGPNGSLVCIEPSPANVELLKRNLELNNIGQRAEVLSGAVSDESTQKDFFLSKHSNLGTFHNEGTGTEYLDGTSIGVKTYTVPELAEKYGAPDLIRMDVEGHEVEIFNGMIPAIAAGKIAPKIIFEIHISKYGEKHDMSQVLDKLFKLGYRTTMMGSSSDRGTALIEKLGYKGSKPILTDGMRRVIFDSIQNEHAKSIICKTGGARTVVLEKKS